jgi:hypothetical protein
VRNASFAGLSESHAHHCATARAAPAIGSRRGPSREPRGHRFILICRRPTLWVVPTLTPTIAAISSHIEALGGHVAEVAVALEPISMPLVLGFSHGSLDRMSDAAGFPTLNWSAARIGLMEIKIIILICAWAAFSVYLIGAE